MGTSPWLQAGTLSTGYSRRRGGGEGGWGRGGGFHSWASLCPARMRSLQFAKTNSREHQSPHLPLKDGNGGPPLMACGDSGHENECEALITVPTWAQQVPSMTLAATLISHGNLSSEDTSPHSMDGKLSPFPVLHSW